MADSISQKIAAVVVSFNGLSLLKRSIDSLRNQTYKIDNIIVVDNSSTDGTREWLIEQSDLDVVYQENSGSSGGQYTGIKKAFEKGYNFIWCMEEEISAKADCLEKMMHFAYNIKLQFSAIASLRLNEHEMIPNYAETIKLDFTKVRHAQRFVKIDEEVLKIDCSQISFATFEGILINSKAIDMIGFPNKDFFLWFDDVEYCHRLRRFNPIYLLSKANVIKMRTFLNSKSDGLKYEYLKYLYGLRNLTFLETKIFNNKGRTIRKYGSLFFYAIKPIKYYYNNFIGLTREKIYFPQVAFSVVRCFRDGLKGKLGKINL